MDRSQQCTLAPPFAPHPPSAPSPASGRRESWARASPGRIRTFCGLVASRLQRILFAHGDGLVRLSGLLVERRQGLRGAHDARVVGREFLVEQYHGIAQQLFASARRSCAISAPANSTALSACHQVPSSDRARAFRSAASAAFGSPCAMAIPAIPRQALARVRPVSSTSGSAANASFSIPARPPAFLP